MSIRDSGVAKAAQRTDVTADGEEGMRAEAGWPSGESPANAKAGRSLNKEQPRQLWSGIHIPRPESQFTHYAGLSLLRLERPARKADPWPVSGSLTGKQFPTPI